MSYYEPEGIAKIKEIDLLTYLQNFEPDELVHFSGNTYVTKSHDSLKISNGKWNWFSRGIGGKTALEYLIQVKGYTFLQTVETLLGKTQIKPPVTYIQEQKKESKFILPQKCDNNHAARQYLMRRGIDEVIIDECIEKRLLYQEARTCNVVFVGYDENKIPRYAAIRGVDGSRFMKEPTGSNKSYSFLLEADKKTDKIHIFESAIDVLSFATILMYNGADWKGQTMLSLGGVYQPAKNIEDSKMPVALQRYLQQNPHIKKISLHLDNDTAGREATKILKNVVLKNYDVLDSPSPNGKDINDYLIYMLGVKPYKKTIPVR